MRSGPAMKGWFDAFRCDGGPTLYNFNNRTAVTGDVTVITILIIFCTLYVAFLIILPGIRKERFTTFFTVTLSLFVGATILVTIYGSGWHVGTTTIVSSYRAFSKEKIRGELGAYVGLRHVNITLQASATSNWTSDVDFNERFLWLTSDQMGDSFYEALSRGLPFPILIVAEYFSIGQEGLSWGGQYRAAGYYATIMLWTAFVLWLFMNLMVIVVPKYGAILMTACGLLLLATVCGYIGMLPENPLVIHIEGSTLHFEFGWCFWIILVAGSICLLSGVIITTVEILLPNSFSTVLEVDYDTPYDRHIIIEDSRGRRFQKKRSNNGGKLEDPGEAGFGRILRRLSSKTREERQAEKQDVSKDRQIYELEQPSKSPWMHSFREDVGRTRLSSISRGSVISSVSRDVPPIHKELSRFRTHPENMHEVSMW